MTGDFNVNVEKLIRHWCPAVEGKELKWVHQLDFGGFLSYDMCTIPRYSGIFGSVRFGSVRFGSVRFGSHKGG